MFLNNNINRLPPFQRFCMSIGEIPSSYKLSMSYEETLLWLCHYLETVVIPAVNNDIAKVEELENLFNILKDYVEHYFDNLDVQEEINNKLDEMVEDGTLANILYNYTNVQRIYTTADEMIADYDNISNNMKIKTLGYHTINDGGDATYYITDELNSNIYQISLNNGLYANTLKPTKNYNVNQFGAYGDGIHDDTVAIQNYFNFLKIGDIANFVNGAKYYISQPIFIDKPISIDFNWCTLIINKDINDFAIYYGYTSNKQWIGHHKLRTYVRNFYVETSNQTFNANCNFLTSALEATIDHFDAHYIDCVISWSPQYIDFSVVKYGYISGRNDSTNYAINIGQQGDLCEISHIQQGGFNGTIGNDHLINIAQNHFNVLIKDIIGSIDCHSPATIENVMLSYTGVINCYGNNVTLKHIRGTLNQKSNNRINIYDYPAPSTPNYNPTITLDDIIFAYSGTESNTDISGGNPIYIDSFNTLCINNVFVGCYRSNGNNFVSKSFAYIKFNESFAEIENYINKYIIQYNGVPFSPEHYKKPIAFEKPLSKTTTFNSGSASAYTKFLNPTATYYYSVQEIYDEDVGIFSTAGNERSVEASYLSSAILLKLTDSNGRFIIKRGTEPGIYTHYVIVSSINSVFIDNGITLNGIKWKQNPPDTTPVTSSKVVGEYFTNKKIFCTQVIDNFINGFTSGDEYIRVSSSNYGKYIYLNNAWHRFNIES